MFYRPPPGFTNLHRPSLHSPLTPLRQPQNCLTDVESHGALRLCLEVWREEEERTLERQKYRKKMRNFLDLLKEYLFRE